MTAQSASVRLTDLRMMSRRHPRACRRQGRDLGQLGELAAAEAQPRTNALRERRGGRRVLRGVAVARFERGAERRHDGLRGCRGVGVRPAAGIGRIDR